MGQHMGNGPVHAVHHRHRQNVVQKFRVEIGRRRRFAGDDGRCARIQPQLHRDLSRGGTVIHHRLFQHGQECVRHRGVHQQHLLGVAHGGTAGLGVHHDPQRLVQIGIFVHIDVTDAGTGLDAGHGGVFHTGADQAGAAPGDQQVHQSLGGHQLHGALAADILHDVDDITVAAGRRDAGLQGLHNGVGGAVGFLAAAQHTHVAAFDGQRRRVGGDVGAALIDDGHQSQRHLLFINGHAVGSAHLRQDAARMVGQRRDIPDTGGHTGDALFVQTQPVQHHLGDVAASRLHVQLVLRQNRVLVCLQTVGHGQQQGVFLLRRSVADVLPCGLRFLQNINGGHSLALPCQKAGPHGFACHDVV